ncbi:MAG: dTMP kinase [Planctomycetaceae bacterium]|nr:MAG: dTMP kinase [Planctomycetaceae bacterium]
MGFFITFEGIEGCGKTTQIKMGGEYLSSKNIPFIITEEPGGIPLGLEIRKILLNESSFAICAESEVFLFSAARAQHVRDVILPTLKEKKIVLCDRFSDATIAYQGFGRGLDVPFIQKINETSTGRLKPDMTLLFDTPVEVGLKRAMKRISRLEGVSREDRFEREALNFHEKVREGYLSLARNEPERFRIIDGTKSIDEVHREVCSHISALIDGRG